MKLSNPFACFYVVALLLVAAVLPGCTLPEPKEMAAWKPSRLVIPPEHPARNAIGVGVVNPKPSEKITKSTDYNEEFSFKYRKKGLEQALRKSLERFGLLAANPEAAKYKIDIADIYTTKTKTRHLIKPGALFTGRGYPVRADYVEVVTRVTYVLRKGNVALDQSIIVGNGHSSRLGVKAERNPLLPPPTEGEIAEFAKVYSVSGNFRSYLTQLIEQVDEYRW